MGPRRSRHCGGGGAELLGAGSLATPGVRYLAASKRFSSDDLLQVCHALEKQRIAYHIDDQKRVQVAADQIEQAADAVAKLDLGQRSIKEIRGDAGAASIWDGPGEREQKEKLKLEQMLERLIGEQDGVLSAVVSVNRPKPSTLARNSGRPSAFVYVETEKGPRAVVPDNPVDPLTAGRFDSRAGAGLDHRHGHARNPLSRPGQSRARRSFANSGPGGRAYRRDPRQARLDQGRASAGAVDHAAHRRGRGQRRGNSQRRQERRARRSPCRDGALERAESDTVAKAAQPVMAINHPLAINGDAEPAFAEASPSATAHGGAVRAQGARRAGEFPNERGRVVVFVPRSFYYKMEIRNDQSEPSLEELKSMADRTEKSVRLALNLLLPDADSWKVDVGTIPDDLSFSRPAILPGAGDSRHRFLEWGLVGAVAGGLSILAIAGSWIRMARRPARVSESSDRSRRYHAGSPLLPSPSERVRELIQRNPEAAASVLQRWVGQGGRSA